MAVRAAEVGAGRLFLTKDQHIRKVVRTVADEQGRTRVHYQCKRADTENRPFLFAHSPSDPPYLEDFIAQCERELTLNEIKQLRRSGVLLIYE